MVVQIDHLALSAAFSQPDDDGTFHGEFAEYLTGLAGKRPIILFAFAPKSAGTFLRSAASAATGGQLVRAVHAQGGREAQLYLPVFIHYCYGGLCEGPMIVHVHMQAHPANCRFIEIMKLKPVVMIRSITDMLASMWDMFDTDPAMRVETVNCIVPEAFVDFTKAEKADFLIDMFAPWYVSFYASWFGYAAEKPETVLMLHYADFKADPAAILERVLKHSDVAQPLDVCKAAIAGTWEERGELRFNKGAQGRGKDYFSPVHFEKLLRMIGHYNSLVPHTQELI
jgi:hypothetical protein